MTTPAFKFDWVPGGFDTKAERAALQRVFTPALAKRVSGVIRKGDSGISQQFAKSTEIGFSGATKWPKNVNLGGGGRRVNLITRKTERPLVRSGALRAAWLGEGRGSIEQVSGDGMELLLGVDTSIIKYAGVHQSLTETIVKAKPGNRSAGGKLKMHWALFFAYGVRITEAKLLAGLKIPPRRVALNDKIMDRAGKMVLAAIFARQLRTAEQVLPSGS